MLHRIPVCAAITLSIVSALAIGCDDPSDGEVDNGLVDSHLVDASVVAFVPMANGSEAAALVDSEPTIYVTALFQANLVPLPDPADVRLEVSGAPCTDANPSEVSSDFALYGRVVGALPTPGRSLGFAITLPGFEPVTRSTPMVHPASLVSPAPGTEIALGEGLQVAWSDAAPGEEDWVTLQLGGAARIVHPVLALAPQGDPDARAPEGATSMYVTPVRFERLYEMLVGSSEIAADAPFEAEIVLNRVRSIDNKPDFSAGQTRLIVEVASTKVVVHP